MNEPKTFYKAQITRLQSILAKEKRKLNHISLLRLLVFVVTCLLLYFFSDNTVLLWIISVLGTALFLFLLRWHTDKKAIYELNKELKTINGEELEILNGNYLKRYAGEEFEDPAHFFSSDIDLFGKGSFFQYVNRTGLQEGTRYFTQILLSNSIKDIVKRQEAIQELGSIPQWRQYFTALARLTKSEIPSDTITKWLQEYRPFIPDILKKIPYLFGFISVAIFAGSVFGLCSSWFLVLWFLAGLGITGFFLKKSNNLNSKTSKVKDTIQQYSLLLIQIEEHAFNSKLLKEEKNKITAHDEKASLIFKRFSKAMDAFDNRNNVLVALLGNGFFLWDVQCAYRIEKWISEYNKLVGQWFETIAFFDAFNTLGAFAFNHPDFTYPSIRTDSEYLVQAKSLGHPLIAFENRVSSDLEIKNTEFFVVTGANMAGKSTFLRTASLFLVMANMGLPICAEQSNYSPIKLITSMRTSDSLTDQSSYFFSELTRLQFIMEQLNQDSYLVILDEILKGTNSVDKAQGSKKLIEQLVEKGVPGIIATHDLSLCDIAKDLNGVKNYFFETEIKNDELHFDYQLKKGVCQNMNASFLLRKMKIVK